MEKQELERRIENKNKDIEKINKRISKWSVGLSDQDKEIAQLEYTKENNVKFKEYCAQNGMGDSWNSPIFELRQANRDLRDANVTLQKYLNALQIKNDQENTEKITVLVEFLKGWKERVIDYIKENIKELDKYYELDREYTDFVNHRFQYVPEKMTLDEYKEKREQMRKEAGNQKALVADLTWDCYRGYSNRVLDMDLLNKRLDEEVERKYWLLIDRVTKVVGNITNTSSLHIAADGNINGVVEGDQGKAYLETIIAGGEIQRDHFRIITHKIKED